MWVPPLMDEYEVRKKKFFSLILIRWRKRFRWPATTMAALPNMAVLNELSVLWNHVTSHTLDCRATKASWNSSVPAVQLFLLSLCVCVCVCVCLPTSAPHSFVRYYPIFFCCVCIFFSDSSIDVRPKDVRSSGEWIKTPRCDELEGPTYFPVFFCVCVLLSVCVCVCVCVC